MVARSGDLTLVVDQRATRVLRSALLTLLAAGLAASCRARPSGNAASPTDPPARSPSPVAAPTSAQAPASGTPAPGPLQASPPASPAPAPLRTQTLGYSVDGRPITALELGDPGAAKTLVLVGCIHGNEPAGIAVAQEMLRLPPPPGINIWVIPDLNPDGVADGTRQNADGVDLNRNFPYQFTVLGHPGDLTYSGASPLSEPESKLAAAFLTRVHPTVSIWYHQHEDLVDLSGGDPSIERAYAAAVGMPAVQLTRYPGSVASWENATFPGSTAFVVELPAGSLSSAGAEQQARAAISVTLGLGSP